MKKFSKIASIAALSAVVMVSCVKNEESDGVKSLRDAQANLINAQSEGALADAKLTLESVMRQYYLNLSTKYQAVKDSLAMEEDKATTVKDLEKIQKEKEIAALDFQAKILVEQGELAQAEANLLDAIQNAATTESQVVSDYLAKYTSLLSDVRNLQNDIDDGKYTVATWGNVDEDFDITNLKRQIEGKKIDKVYLQAKYDNLTKVAAAYNNVVTDPTTAVAAVATARTNKEAAYSLLEAKKVETANALTVYDQKAAAATLAKNARVDIQGAIADLSDDNSADQDAIYYYESKINAAQIAIRTQEAAINALNVTLAEQTALYNTWNSKYSTAQSAFRTAESAYSTANANVKAKEAALAAAQLYDAQYGTSTATAAQTELDAANTALTPIAETYNDAYVVYTQALNNLNVYTNSVDAIKADISDAQSALTIARNELTQYTNVLASKNTDLTTLNGQLDAAIAAEEAARLAQIAANDSWSKLSDEQSVLTDNYNKLNTLLTNLTVLMNGVKDNNDSYLTAVEGYKKDLNDLLNDIEDKDEEIAQLNKQIADVTAELLDDAAFIAAKNAEITGWEAELVLLKAELTRYYALVDDAIAETQE